MAGVALAVVAAGSAGAWSVLCGRRVAPAVSIPVPADWSLVAAGARRPLTEAVEACRRTPEDAAAFALLGRMYHGNVEPALAVASYERAIEMGAEDAQTPYLLALLYVDRGDPRRAAGLFGVAERRDPTHAPLHYHLGRALLESAQPDAAIDAFQQATRIEPTAAVFHTGLGRALRQAGRLEEAADALRTALTLDPKQAGAHQLLGLTLRALGDNAGAREHLANVHRYAVEVIKDDWLWEAHQYAASPDTLLEWARSYIESGRLGSAVKLLTKLATVYPDRAEVFRRLGEAYARSGEADRAAEAYSRATTIEPLDAGTHAALAELLLQRDDLAGAQREIALALDAAPAHLQARTIEAAIMLHRGQAAEATAQLQTLVMRRGDLAGANFWLGEALMAQNRFAEAAQAYERVVKLRPDSSSARSRLQLANEKSGRSGS